MKKITKTITKEYDTNGKLIKETEITIEEETKPVNPYLAPYQWYNPVRPKTNPQPPVTADWLYRPRLTTYGGSAQNPDAYLVMFRQK